MTGVRKVVYAASGGTLYGEPRKLPVKETALSGSRPVSPYGISKKVVIDYLSFYERYHGIDWTALALANVYGPRQDPNGEAGVVAIFSSKMLAGQAPTIFGDGNQTRDYVFVDDVVHAFALAAERGGGRLVNVGTAVETSVNGLYRMLSGITGFEGAPAGGPARQGDLRRSVLDIALAGGRPRVEAVDPSRGRSGGDGLLHEGIDRRWCRGPGGFPHLVAASGRVTMGHGRRRAARFGRSLDPAQWLVVSGTLREADLASLLEGTAEARAGT